MGFKAIRMRDAVGFVATADDAIDWDAMAAAWLKTDEELAAHKELDRDQRLAAARYKATFDYISKALRDPSAAVASLMLRSGHEPCVFTVGAIPPDEFARMNDECRVGIRDEWKREELWWRSFVAGLRNIERWPEGKPPRYTSNGLERVDPDWIAKIFTRGMREVALEVGRIAWHWNKLTDEEAKN